MRPSGTTATQRVWAAGSPERDDRQQRVVEEERDGDDEQGEDLHEEVDDSLLEEHGERLDIGGHAGEQDARLLLGVEADALAVHVAEHPNAKLFVEPLTETTRVTPRAHPSRAATITAPT